MKKILLSLLIVMILAIGTVNADLGSIQDIDISVISQDPDPVEAGSYVELRFKLENFGYGDAEDVEIELIPKFPLSLEPGEEKVKFIGSVGGRQVEVKAYTFDYKLRVDSDALDGENEIDLRWRAKGMSWAKTSFTVDIQTAASLLSIKEFSSDPLRIKPGEVANLKIVLANGAYSFIKDIKVKLSLLEVVQSAAGVTLHELPFSPMGSSDEKIISKINGKSFEDVTFNLVASADAETKIYKIPVLISFADSTGRRYNQSNIISLIIGDEPDLIIGIEESDIYKIGQTGKISVKFVNKGFSDIKFLYVQLRSSENYKILSAEDSYIGNIDSDDYETAEFEIFLKEGEDGYVTIPLEIEFKDANNVEYERIIDLKLKLLDDDEAKKVGLKKSNKAGGIIVTLAIVVIGFLIYRWLRKKKKK